MENDGLSNDVMKCVCAVCPRGGELGAVCLMHPKALASDALDALERWAREEDGMLPEAWAVYGRLHLAVCGTLPPDTEAM